jgi:hypothetical protein
MSGLQLLYFSGLNQSLITIPKYKAGYSFYRQVFGLFFPCFPVFGQIKIDSAQD